MSILGGRAASSRLALLAAAALAAFSASAWAGPGDLDPMFGSGGVVTLSPGTSSDANAVAVQSDGKIVVAGYAITSAPGNMTVARLDSSGNPDPAFGSGGVVIVSGAVQSIAYALAIQPDDGILVAGALLTPTIENNHQVVRLLPADGQLDPAFGSGGIVVTPTESTDGRATLALQPDGKILLGGAVKRHIGGSTTANRDFLVARYLSGGTLDPAFGVAGRASIDMGGHSDTVTGLVIQPDGRIVASGYAISKRRARFALTRLDAAGTLDRSFARRGRFRRRLVARFEFAQGLASLPDGRIVAGGESVLVDFPRRDGMTLAQFAPGGDLDPSFGTGGVAAQAPDPLASYAVRQMARQPDGKILLAGALNGPTGEPTGGILLARFLDDGSLDPSFGAGGIVNTPVGDQAIADAITLQVDGKIVIAGYSVTGGQAHFVVARYLP